MAFIDGGAQGGHLDIDDSAQGVVICSNARGVTVQRLIERCWVDNRVWKPKLRLYLGWMHAFQITIGHAKPITHGCVGMHIDRTYRGAMLVCRVDGYA